MTNLTQTRMAYGEALLELGRHRQDIVVLDADLYTSTRSELFAKEFPETVFRHRHRRAGPGQHIRRAGGLRSYSLLQFVRDFPDRPLL